MCVPCHTDATLHMWPWDQFVLMSVRLSRLYPSFFPFSIDLSVCFSSNLISKSFHHSYTSRQKYYFYLVTHSFHLKRLYKMDTCSFSITHTHTYFSTALSPQRSSECVRYSSWQFIPFCLSLSFSYHSKNRRQVSLEVWWEEESIPTGIQHTHTHTICSAHLILEERKERACKQ